MFQNMGLVAILGILLSEWMMERPLKNDVSISILAMIYFVFFSINIMTYFALTNVQSFLAILFRLSQIMEMEEHKRKRVSHFEND